MFNADVPEEDIVGALQRIEEKFRQKNFHFNFSKQVVLSVSNKAGLPIEHCIMLKQQSKRDCQSRLWKRCRSLLINSPYQNPKLKTSEE